MSLFPEGSPTILARNHCAKFTDSILQAAVLELRAVGASTVLDPFAGTGKGVEYLRSYGFDAWGVELEPEWAEISEHVNRGDALEIPADGSWDAVFTSPTYGNRMADRDLRESVAGTYAKSLGRHASDGSSCHMQWGEEYRLFHTMSWRAVRGALKPSGHFLLNISDHVRAGEVVPVSEWHVRTCEGLGFLLEKSVSVPTPRLRFGANGAARVDCEWLHVLRKPPTETLPGVS